MSFVRYALINAIATLIRLVPWPCKPGLVEVGHPGRSSPVLLTCNYRLTVERVRRALRDMDAYLLVANSRGINVWCAAAGGLFTHHDVISALKTSGVEERVDHRAVILPQLAAAGVEARQVCQRAGWEVTWGPVDARDLPAFLRSGGHKPAAMRERSLLRAVSFGWPQRIEMAVAWAFPISAFVVLVLLILWRAALVPALLLTWGLALLLFLGFPLYARWLGPHRPRSTGAKRVSFDQGGLQLILWGLCLIGLVICAALSGTLGWAWLWRWGLLALVLIILVTVDLTGMTPVYKSAMQEERRFRIVLELERCTGDGICEQVCPRNCFVVDAEGSGSARGKAAMPGSSRCVQCGACVVQCPSNALSFVGPAGEALAPETIRRFKLNLMGRRARPGA